MSEMNRTPWPEVDPPEGWKQNPHAGKRLTTILLLTVVLAGGITALSAGRSEILPVVCFLALVALPIAGPLVSRIGYGSNYKEARELHTVTAEELKAENGRMLHWRGPHQKLVIPDEMNGAPLAEAAEGLFANQRALAFVHLPQGLHEIPARMFYRCDNLPAIVIPPMVQRIGSRAFAACADLKDVYLPASVTEIAPDAFEGCGSVLLHVRPGSEAERFAKAHGFLCANG